VGNVSRFNPSEAHYLFEEGANHNVVAGHHGDVFDRGEGNRSTGLTKKPGNIGQQISDAMQQRREKVKQMLWLRLCNGKPPLLSIGLEQR
jgi:hypothetical protein